MTDVLLFRAQKDAFFKHDPSSPLTQEQKRTFTGLRYFPVDPSLEFAAQIEQADKSERVSLKTSTGALQIYLRIGRIRFRVDGQEASLELFENPHGYFVPFVDATAPAETYGAGRYLEPRGLGPGRVHVDFNLAYNPYCAYNDRWSCPVPPAGNRISVRIEAGEKKFHG